MMEGRIRRRPARRSDRKTPSKTGRPHQSHEGKGRHSQADARMGLGGAQQQYRVQNLGQGARQTEIPEHETHHRIPRLGEVTPHAGRDRLGVFRHLYTSEGRLNAPLALSGLPKYNIGSRRPARPPQASEQRDPPDTGEFPVAVAHHSSGSAGNMRKHRHRCCFEPQNPCLALPDLVQTLPQCLGSH